MDKFYRVCYRLERTYFLLLSVARPKKRLYADSP
jgi:hypothetical protein